MTADDKDILLQRLDQSRLKIEELLPGIDPAREIYSGWRIREILAHMTGWDEASIDALQAHDANHPPLVPAIHSLGEYNHVSVSSRKDLSYDQIQNEWRLKRTVLRDIIRQLPEEKIHELIVVPWGKRTTITKIVEIFSNHEKEHAHDINQWLKHPEKPLGKAGK